MTKPLRTGAVGALLDEYERALDDLKRVIETIPDPALPFVIDAQTTNADCRSVQSVLAHVVSSGFGYATSIHNHQGHQLARPAKVPRPTIREYLDDLDRVFEFTARVFAELQDADLEQLDDSRKIKTGWGQLYDIEQLTEHAIVHVLRHRRQLEKFKVLLGVE